MSGLTKKKATLVMGRIMTNNDNWWDSQWFKEYHQLVKDRPINSTAPIGEWKCYVNEDGELIYKYIKWNEI